MMASQNPHLNPALEELRLKAIHTSGNTHDFISEVHDIIRLTSRIHAAFLFHSPKTLQPLLRTLGETSGSATEVGWQSFGDKLGLNMSTLKVINNNRFNHEDPVYNILLSFVQYEDATIGKIIQVLLDMKRFDVIVRSKDLILELTEVVLQHEQRLLVTSPTTSDYGSSESNDASGEYLDETIIKPDVIPEAPLIMKNVQAVPLISTLLLQGVSSSRTNVICSPVFSQTFQSETLLKAAPVITPSNKSSISTGSSVESNAAKPKQNCAKKVLLTFTADGSEYATEAARILRQQRGCQRIGVLILGEQLNHLQPDPNLFISASVQLVDYVIPILTEGYLRTVLRQVTPSHGSSDCIDADYVPFIYQNMVQDYTKRGCLNDKVRCLIPDKQIDKILTYLIMAGPLFAAWEKISRTDILAERILSMNV